MHVSMKLLLDLRELDPHPVAPCQALKLIRPAPGFTADEDEAQKGEGFGLTQTAPLAFRHREAAKLEQARLFPVQFEPKLLESHSHRIPEALCIGLMLEAHDDVVCIPHDDYVPGCFSLSPLRGPEVKDIVKVDVRQ